MTDKELKRKRRVPLGLDSRWWVKHVQVEDGLETELRFKEKFELEGQFFKLEHRN